MTCQHEYDTNDEDDNSSSNNNNRDNDGNGDLIIFATIFTKCPGSRLFMTRYQGKHRPSVAPHSLADQGQCRQDVPAFWNVC